MSGRALGSRLRLLMLVISAGAVATACGERKVVDPGTAASTSRKASGEAPEFEALPRDSATAVYVEARRALDRGDSVDAIAKFERVFVQWPQSDRSPHAMYWKAFVLDRRGGTENLRVASNLLDLATQIAPTSYAVGDAATLLLRVRARLAAAGDDEALRALGVANAAAWKACADTTAATRLSWAVEPAQPPEVRLARLRTLMRGRGSCAAPLREQTLLLLARIGNGEGIADIVGAAADDDALSVRRSAVRVLPRPAPDAARALLQRVLAIEQDVAMLEAAASAWRSRRDWGVEPLHAYLRRSDRNATVTGYVETLLRR